MTFADKLIRLRKRNGMSQEDLADKLGVSRQAISKWEGMLSVPDLQNVLKISELFNVTTDYLLKDRIVDENAGAAGTDVIGAGRGEARKDEPEDDEFIEVRKETREASELVGKRTGVRLYLAAGILLIIGAVVDLTLVLANAQVLTPNIMKFVHIALCIIAGVLLICTVKEDKIAIAGFITLILKFLIGSINCLATSIRYPVYLFDLFIGMGETAVFVMATIAFFVKKPVKLVRAMAIVACVCAALQCVFYLAMLNWEGMAFTEIPSTVFVAMVLIAVALSPDGDKESAHKAGLGLAGLMLVVIGAMTTVWYLIAAGCGWKGMDKYIIYVCVDASISIVGYALLPYILCYETKKPVRGISGKKGYFNIAAHILLTGVTAYIWHWVWVYRTSDTVRGYKGGGGLPAWVQLILYFFVPFYHIYWFYKHGRDISEQEKLIGRADKKLDAVTVVFAVLTPFVASVVLQDRLNAVAIAKSESIEETDLEAAVI